MISTPSNRLRRLGLIGGVGGCLIVILSVVCITSFVLALVGGILGIVNTAFRSAEPYQEALAAAQSNSDVVEALGEPIEAGWFVTGSIRTQGLSGSADLVIPLSGPKGNGTLYVTAWRENGVWRYTTLAAQVEGREEIIQLER